MTAGKSMLGPQAGVVVLVLWHIISFVYRYLLFLPQVVKPSMCFFKCCLLGYIFAKEATASRLLGGLKEHTVRFFVN